MRGDYIVLCLNDCRVRLLERRRQIMIFAVTIGGAVFQRFEAYEEAVACYIAVRRDYGSRADVELVALDYADAKGVRMNGQ